MVHDAKRCVSNKAIEEIADILDLSPAQINDTLSFYGYFRSESNPQGKSEFGFAGHCLACSAGEELLAELSRRWGIQPGETTPDGKLSLELAECLGLAMVLLVCW